MFLGIVSGTIVSTIHHAFYDGKKLLVIDRCDESWSLTGKYVIAIDAAGAGVGQRVLVLDEGNGARQIVDDANAPVRSVVVGIVDEAHVG
ncbi:MAG: EutN/CcmL family microcompartment protein [Deltaproteobacteria bacterium]|nr:EutN/CcmL family microcompartment protein [Deltaproteobacteria bacterium]